MYVTVFRLSSHSLPPCFVLWYSPSATGYSRPFLTGRDRCARRLAGYQPSSGNHPAVLDPIRIVVTSRRTHRYRRHRHRFPRYQSWLDRCNTLYTARAFVSWPGPMPSSLNMFHVPRTLSVMRVTRRRGTSLIRPARRSAPLPNSSFLPPLRWRRRAPSVTARRLRRL